MMFVAFILSINLISLEAAAPVHVEVEKEIRYKKETAIDLSGSNVNGEKQAPPAFFVTKKEAPNAARLLDERLKFKLIRYNELGF